MNKSYYIIIILAIFSACSAPPFDAAMKQAEGEIGLGNFEKAAKLYKRLAVNYPKDERTSVVWLRLGDLHSNSLGDLKQGLESYQKAIESSPTSEIARLARERRAELYGRMDNAEGMVEEYTALLKYFGDYADTPTYRMRLGEAYIMTSEFQQARTELRSFVEKAGVPSDLRERALFDIGETYFLEGKSAKAVRFYNALIQENPKSPLVFEAELRIATCLEEMGYLGMAQKFTQEAGKGYPNKKVIEERLKGIEGRGKTKGDSPPK